MPARFQPDHWTQDPAVGGGRIIGEGAILSICCSSWRVLDCFAASDALGTRQQSFMGDDKVTFTLAFADGSAGTVHYLANGHRTFAKERLEVFCAGRILALDNFRRLRGFGWPGF